jgi:8-oxo-dGTP diphosphatase
MSHDILRAQIRETVAAITPLDPAETHAQASVLEWIDSAAPLFRDHGPVPPRHLAVYFAVLDEAWRTVLQVDHIKAAAWVFPGGHVDTEPPAAAVLREAEEELSIAASFHPAFGDRPLFVTESVTRGPGEHVDVTLWHVLAGSRDMPLIGDTGEFDDLRWVSIDDPDSWVDTCYAPSEMRRCVTKLQQILAVAAAHA